MNRDRETGRLLGPRARFTGALRRQFLLSLSPLWALSPLAADAVTLGGYEVQSALGQSLRMTVQVAARPDEEFDSNCFRLNPFSVAGDGLPQLTSAQMRLERRGNEQRLIITSPRAIMDPIVRLAIDVGCDTTLRREITLLLDPPSAVETLPQVAETRPAPIPIPPSGRGATTAPSVAGTDGGTAGGRAPAPPPASAAAPSSAPPARTATADAAAAAAAGRAATDAARAAAAAAPKSTPRPAPRPEAVPPVAQVAPRPPRSLQPPDTRVRPTAPPAVRSGSGAGDRLTISASPLPLQSSGDTLSPRLNLATTLAGERGRPPISENTMSMLRQKQARLRAAPAGEDLPSLEAEVVVLQKRTSEMQRQLDQVLAQMAGLAAKTDAVTKAGLAARTDTPATAAQAAKTDAASKTDAAAMAGQAAKEAAAAAAAATRSPDPGAPLAAAKAPELAPILPAPKVANPAGKQTSKTGQPAAQPPVQPPAQQTGQKSSASLPWSSIWSDPKMLFAGPLAIALLVLVIGFLLWLRRERDDQRRSERWAHVPIAADGGGGAPAPSIDRAPMMPAPTIAPKPAPAARNEILTAPLEEFQPRTASDGYQYKTYSSGQAAQDLGVSDLAQATEKASVFVTLGRPAQAIDVLRDHIDHEPKSSPMAWLMLLDLYRQTDRYEDFNEVAQRFHLDFNAVTPEWHQSLAPLRDAGLGAFPYLIARIRDHWPSPESRSFIEELLYDNRGGSRIGFSIPAFRDLLLLHSLLDEYLHSVQNKGQADPATGRVVEMPPPPAPPDHLASIWKTASPERPVYTTPLPEQPLPGSSPASAPDMLPALSMDLASAPAPAAAADFLAHAVPSYAASQHSQPSALEKSYPIIAEAIVNRWGQAGLAGYLSNLIRSSTDHGAGLTNEALAELVLLHDIALDLGEPETKFSLA